MKEKTFWDKETSINNRVLAIFMATCLFVGGVFVGRASVESEREHFRREKHEHMRQIKQKSIKQDKNAKEDVKKSMKKQKRDKKPKYDRSEQNCD